MTLFKNKKTVKTEIIPVGTEDIGFFYFLKYGYIKVGERNQLEAHDLDRQESAFALDNLVETISQDRKISRKEASNLIFGYEDISGATVAAVPISELYAEYPNQVSQFLKKSSSQLYKIAIATLFIKGFYTQGDNQVVFMPGRSLKPVTAVEDLVINSTNIKIEPNYFPLKSGQQIKFKGGTITLDEDVVAVDVSEDEPVEIKVKPLTKAIIFDKTDIHSSTGFVYCPDGKTYITGDEEWSDAKTIELNPDLLDLIYLFYQKEQMGWKEEANEKKQDMIQSQNGIQEKEETATVKEQVVQTKTLEVKVLPQTLNGGGFSTDSSAMELMIVE